MKKIYAISILILFLIIIFISACSKHVARISRTENIYPDTHRKSENTTVSYTLPIIKSTGKTEQTQSKGGVTISAEITPFTATRGVKQDRKISYADNSQTGYDIYEVSNTPEYQVAPEDINFKIRIRNNEAVPLKLSEVGFAIIIDGTQWSFPSGYLDDWNKGLILTGFEKEYMIKGPQLQGLYNAQVVYIFLNGVPTSYDEAGTVTKKSNFEWYFECKSATVEKQEQITYTYESEPIESRQCAKCGGTGTDPQAYKCPDCNGTGRHYNPYDKKTYQCSKCNGGGIVRYKCPECKGRGSISYPKSRLPNPISSVTWNGWYVTVVTNPNGADIKFIDTSTGEYRDASCSSPCKIPWYCTSGKSCPVIIEYGGKIVKVLPYKSDESQSPKIVVDFTGGSPYVKTGKEAN